MNRRSHPNPAVAVARAMATVGLVLLPSVAGGQSSAALTRARSIAPNIVGAESCGECHISAFEVWKQTPHATGFKTLHRGESAEAIAQKMGIRLLKRDSPCLGCHYTPGLRGDQVRAISGASCESCHGAAKDWLNVHNDYGGRGIDFSTETPEHRTQRIEASRRAGMRRPSDLYAVAASCFECHLVPDERLVNVGGHNTGSGNFELVGWSQGEIRHNFLQSFLTGDGTENVERSLPRKRMMYVIGRTAELEHALRGVAAATEQGVYLKAMIRRVRNAVAELREIAARTSLPEITEMLGAVRAVKVGLGHRTDLLAAAAGVAERGRSLAEREDGSHLAAVDPLLLGTAGEPALRQVQAGPVPAAEAAGPAASPGRPSEARPADRGEAKTGASSDRRPSQQAAAPKKTRLRPSSSHQTLGQGSCSGCHAPQNEWWFDDAHYRTTDPFFNQEAANVQIARLYGIRPEEMTRGNQLCMDCHGTVVSGKESREVLDGVSCESCHGPAKDWLEPHKDEEGEELGRERPGYRRALELGKLELNDLRVRASSCASCHYITDARLISAGHSSGVDFDYVQGLMQVRHWQRPLEAAAGLTTSYAATVGSRGGVPSVSRRTLASASSAGTGRGEVTGTTVSADPGGGAGNPTPPTPPRPRPVDPLPITAPVPGGALPTSPEIDEDAAVEDVLLWLKERLEALQRAVRGAS